MIWNKRENHPNVIKDNKADWKDSFGYNLPVRFKHDWIRHKVIAPRSLAHTRVMFYEEGNPSNFISSYLDISDSLGCVGVPYFEIYPTLDDDTERFLLEEETNMYDRIADILDARSKKK